MALPKITDNLLTTQLVDELLVYDRQTATAHCLGLVGKTVFEGCEQSLAEDDLLKRLEAAGAVDPKAVLEQTLVELSNLGLVSSTSPKGEFDRRKFLAAAGALAAVPVVASVLAPQPAQAISCTNCATVGGVPTSCLTCGRNCPAVGCTATAVCCFEYIIVDDDADGTPNVPAGAECTTFGPVEFFGAYGCRSGRSINSYTANLTFFKDCKAAREAVLAAPGNHTSETYYCCNCSNQGGPPDPGVNFSCNV